MKQKKKYQWTSALCGLYSCLKALTEPALILRSIQTYKGYVDNIFLQLLGIGLYENQAVGGVSICYTFNHKTQLFKENSVYYKRSPFLIGVCGRLKPPWLSATGQSPPEAQQHRSGCSTTQLTCSDDLSYPSPKKSYRAPIPALKGQLPLPHCYYQTVTTAECIVTEDKLSELLHSDFTAGPNLKGM